MTQVRVPCAFCNDPINPDTSYRRIRGWEKARIQGGANQITLREVEDVWACRHCVDRLLRGIAPAQLAMA